MIICRLRAHVLRRLLRQGIQVLADQQHVPVPVHFPDAGHPFADLKGPHRFPAVQGNPVKNGLFASLLRFIRLAAAALEQNGPLVLKNPDALMTGRGQLSAGTGGQICHVQIAQIRIFLPVHPGNGEKCGISRRAQQRIAEKTQLGQRGRGNFIHNNRPPNSISHRHLHLRKRQPGLALSQRQSCFLNRPCPFAAGPLVNGKPGTCGHAPGRNRRVYSITTWLKFTVPPRER